MRNIVGPRRLAASKATGMLKALTGKPGAAASNIPLPGSKSGARTQGSPRNVGWSLDALVDENGSARGTEAAPGVEGAERAVGGETGGEQLQGAPPRQGARRRISSLEGKMTETPSSLDISTKLERIAKLARELRGARLLTLAH